MPSSCALLGGFAIGADSVSLLWQHSAEREMSASACTRCMPGCRLWSVLWFALGHWHQLWGDGGWWGCIPHYIIWREYLLGNPAYLTFMFWSRCTGMMLFRVMHQRLWLPRTIWRAYKECQPGVIDEMTPLLSVLLCWRLMGRAFSLL